MGRVLRIGYPNPGTYSLRTVEGSYALAGQAVSFSSGSSFVLRDATNTGLAGASISEGSLTTQGDVTYNSAFNGQTISGKKFTGTVTVTATNLTISGCLFEFAGGDYKVIPDGSGDGLTLVDCTARCTSLSSGAGWFILNPGSNFVMRRCDISGAENILTIDGNQTNMLIEDSFLHYPSSSDPSGHNDILEIYGGNGVTIQRNTIILDGGAGVGAPTCAINIAPFVGGVIAQNIDILDNYIDGEFWAEILMDPTQGDANDIRNVRVLRNRFGGHNGGGAYGTGLDNGAFQTNGGMTRVATDTAGNLQYYVPYTGADVNYWDYCVDNPFGFSDLSPDRSGDIYTGAV